MLVNKGPWLFLQETQWLEGCDHGSINTLLSSWHASAEGQRIYTITSDNLYTAMAQLQLSADTEQKIQNTVEAGFEVTTHEYRINFNGWIGEGYIIIDPNTGAGAYKKAGGSNGSIVAAISALFGVGGVLTGYGSIFEDLVGLGKLYRNLGIALGAVAALLSVVDAVASGCGAMATFWIFMFNYMIWLFTFLPLFFTFALHWLALFIVSLVLAQFFVTSMMKEDFCDAEN